MLPIWSGWSRCSGKSAQRADFVRRSRISTRRDFVHSAGVDFVLRFCIGLLFPNIRETICPCFIGNEIRLRRSKSLRDEILPLRGRLKSTLRVDIDKSLVPPVRV